MNDLLIKVREWLKPLELMDLPLIILFVITLWFLLIWVI